jgi:nicotinate-nucleotide pyrophosphorylase (carboxylating)
MAMNEQSVSHVAVRQTVRRALEEDLGRGDVTTACCVPAQRWSEAHLRSRQQLVLAGIEVVREVYRQVDPRVELTAEHGDGEEIGASTTVARLYGPARALLSGERVALNFLQRLSGVATLTRSYVSALPAGCSTRIVDTRKTTPGLRALQRHAVRCGGGHNHRFDLSAAVLIKDNHIAAAGGVQAAVTRARQGAPHTARVECEVDDLDQLEQALQAGAEVVLLDNFTDDQVAEAVRIARGRALIEVSGGITRERVEPLARAGVDAISVGALTHSAGSVDLALDWA